MRIGLVVAGAQCRLRQWLEVHGTTESQPLRASAANSRRLRAAVRERHPGRFDEVFSADGVEFRADLIEEVEGGIGLRRLRPATRRKRWHIDELALQVHVLRRNGLRVVSAEIWRLDRRYRLSGELDLDGALKKTEHLWACEARIHQWAARVEELTAMPEEEPEVAVGPHCSRPRRCPFAVRCGVPRREPKPGPVQDRIEQARRNGQPVIDRSLAEDLASSGPVFALDFEAWAPALPVFQGTAPFEPVVVQWSLHRAEGEDVRHFGGLATPGSDPRGWLVESLLEVLDEPGPIYVYSDFERRALARLAAKDERVQAIIDRLVDLQALIRAKYVHPDFEGGFGLKRVLPVLVPGAGFSDLELADGGEAALAYGRLVDEDDPALRAKLEAYCARDSLALLQIRQALLARAPIR